MRIESKEEMLSKTCPFWQDKCREDCQFFRVNREMARSKTSDHYISDKGVDVYWCALGGKTND